MFIGKHENCIDAKSRVIIPAKFREDLGSPCVITIGIDDCLCVYTMEDFQKFSDKLLAIPHTDENAREFSRIFFSNAEKVELDKQGRILLSSGLKDYAGIEKDLVTVGTMNKIEIWSKEIWEKRQGNALTPNERAKKMVEYGI